MAEHVVETRQKDDELFTSLARQTGGQVFSAPLPAGGTLSQPVRLVLGYTVVRFFALANQTLLLRVEQAPTLDGPWVEVLRTPSVPSPDLLGMQVICAEVGPCGPYMRVFVDNTGPVPANPFWFQGFGHPVASGGVGAGGGGITTNVNLKDCATTTEASIKPDGGPISPAPCDGGLLIAGRDAVGFQRHIRVNTAGNLVISTIGNPETANAQQDLALGPLSLVSTFAENFEPRWVSLSFDVPLVANETASIFLRSALGAAYDVLVEEVTLAPASDATHQAYFFSFPPETLLSIGDEIEVQLTNTGGAETAIVSAVILGEA